MNDTAGRVEDIQRYHRASRLLFSCLLLPLAVGLLVLEDDILYFFVLCLIWMLSSQVNSRALSELAVYDPGLEPAVKLARWRSVLWEKIRHELVGLVAVAFMLFCLQVFIKHPAPPDEEFPLKFTHAWITLFYIAAFLPLIDTMLPQKPGGRILWVLLSSMLSDVFLHLPHVLILLMYLLGLAYRTPARRHALITHASGLCSGTCFLLAIVTTLWIIGLLLAGILEEEISAQLEFEPLLLTWPFFLLVLHSLMKHERIRHGLFIADFDGIGKKKLRRMKRGSLLRAFDPQEAAAGYWKWMRLVTRLGRSAWLVALLSILAAVAIGFSQPA